jgi:hypothetical protein
MDRVGSVTVPLVADVKVAAPVITGLPLWFHSAVIAVDPKPACVASPEELIVATATSLETHFKLGELVMS